jgi:hypothetical protein
VKCIKNRIGQGEEPEMKEESRRKNFNLTHILFLLIVEPAAGSNRRRGNALFLVICDR